MLEPFTTLKSPGAPLLQANIDTDLIIRIERLTALPRNELGPYALEALRYLHDGSENPDFVFNTPRFRGSQIIVGGENFGCGSSREAAVWALKSYGIRCIIAPSFGDLFYSNCMQNGLLPVRLPEGAFGRIAMMAKEGVVFEIALAAQQISADAEIFNFEIDPLHKQSLMHGMDPVAMTLRSKGKILAWQAGDRERRPWAWAIASPAHKQ